MKRKLTFGKVLTFTVALCLMAAFVAPIVVSAAPATNTQAGACGNLTNTGLKGVVGCIIEILNTVVGLLIAGGVVYTVYGAFQMVQSEEKRDEGKQRIYHGIIGLFIMVSIWGLVNILTSTFNLIGTPVAAPVIQAPAGTGDVPGFDGSS